MEVSKGWRCYFVLMQTGDGRATPTANPCASPSERSRPCKMRLQTHPAMNDRYQYLVEGPRSPTLTTAMQDRKCKWPCFKTHAQKLSRSTLSKVSCQIADSNAAPCSCNRHDYPSSALDPIVQNVFQALSYLQHLCMLF